MRTKNAGLLKRVRDLEAELKRVHEMVIMMGVVSDILNMKHIVTEKEIRDHIDAVTERIKHEAGSQIS